MNPSDTMLAVTLTGEAAQTPTTSVFPESPRVIYTKNPLISVSCQIKFAPVLRIESEAPATFQEAIRSSYPLLRERPDVPIGLPPEIPAPIAAVLRAQIGSPGRRLGYDFISADEQWTATLTRDFLSVGTKHYETWADFKAHLSGPLGALCGVYAPAFFTRVGLRYQDLIQRSKLKLTDVPWKELLQPRISGLLAEPNVNVAVSRSEVVVSFDHGEGLVRIHHGLAQTDDTKEECYLIDSDFFIEGRTPADAALGSLDFFNVQSGRLFRWFISERLHLAMDPKQPGQQPISTV